MEIFAMFRAELRREIFSLANDGYRDEYDFRLRKAGIEMILRFLILLKPEYRGEDDRPLQCHAPDCDKWFFPSPHSHGQKYHVTTCRSRHNMQKRRLAGK